MNFKTYQAACIARIKQRRVDYAAADATFQHTLIEANAPFERVPKQACSQAVILIHGLYDTPCIMQSLADFFQQENYWVRAILLPGHGTRAEDLCDIRFEAWLSACHLAITLLPPGIKRIILAGFSTGGLLSQYLALQQSIPQLVGIISLSPAMALPPLAQALLHRSWLVKAWLRLSPWGGKRSPGDYAKYDQHALNGAYQVQRLIDHCPKQACHLPTFWVLSANDKVIDAKRTWQYFHRYNHAPQSRCMIYSPKPLKLPSDTRLSVHNSCFPAEHILNFSHICLGIAPNHPHYGREGDYTQAMKAHLDPNQTLYQGEFGGRTTLRLSYNPDFEAMTTALRAFLKSL